MATRTAYYICKSDAYAVFESDKTTVISTYAAHDIPSDDEEIGDDARGTYDDVANTFTFDTGGAIDLS